MANHEKKIKEIDFLNSKGWTDSIITPEQTISSTLDAFDQSDRLGYESGKAKAKLNSGWCYIYLSKIDDALAAFEIAHGIFTSEHDNRGILYALNGLGNCYQIMSRYDLAMDYYLKGLDLSHEIGDREREASVLNFIGGVCLELGKVKEGLDYFLKAYDALSGIIEPEVEGHIVGNIGKAFKEMGNLELAQDFTRKAITFAELLNDRIRQSECFTTLGQLALEENKHEEAFSWQAKALDLCRVSGNELGRVQTLLNLGDLLFSLGKYEEAKQCIMDSLSISLEMQSKRHAYMANFKLSSLEEVSGNHEMALNLYKEAARLEHEVINEESTRKLKNIQFQHDIEKSRTDAELFRLKNVELKQQAERLESAHKSIELISEIGQRVMSNLSGDAIIRLIAKEISGILASSSVGIAFYQKSHGLLRFTLFNEHGKRLPVNIIQAKAESSLALHAISGREVLLINDIETDWPVYIAQIPKKPEPVAGSAIIVPLYTKGKVFGTLIVQNRKCGVYGQNDRYLLTALSQYISIALENARNHDKLEDLYHELKREKDELIRASAEIARLANHDNLTGLPNRRLLFELLKQSFELATRTGTMVAVIFIDLDDFKPINDLYGHQAGDRALIAVAERLKSSLRGSDTVARVGGDEFVVCLNQIRSREDAAVICEKILEECLKPFQLEGNTSDIGMSMGVSIYPEDGTTIDRLLNKADAAMYGVKRSQKRGVAFHH